MTVELVPDAFDNLFCCVPGCERKGEVTTFSLYVCEPLDRVMVFTSCDRCAPELLVYSTKHWARMGADMAAFPSDLVHVSKLPEIVDILLDDPDPLPISVTMGTPWIYRPIVA